MRRRCLRAAAVVALVGLVIATALVPHRQVLTTIEINAAPDRVWAILTDTASYPEWNPLIAGLNGKLSPGAVVENIEGHGDNQIILWPTILDVRPERELRWRGKLWGVPRLLDGEHYFLLEPSASGTRFTQGEQLYGVLLWLFDAQQLEPRFAAMNVALEARAEHDPPADMRLGAPWTDQGSN